MPPARAGDYGYGRRFWRDEYRMNARLAEYPKPVVSLLQGFVMGGGVGLGCHCSHRLVGETSQIAMPECGIGLMPDVGGSYLLARAPGRLGEYLGLTGARMGPADAILRAASPTLRARGRTGPTCGRRWSRPATRAGSPPRRHRRPRRRLAARRAEIDAAFGAESVEAIRDRLAAGGSDFAARGACRRSRRNAPLSLAGTLALLRPLRARPDDPPCADAGIPLHLPRRWNTPISSKASAPQIIDKDRNPGWRHAGTAGRPRRRWRRCSRRSGRAELTFEEERP